MAVLSDTGRHCDLKECRQRDFLPFRCDQCAGSFCLEHFRYAAHSCPKAAGLDNRVLVCPLCEKAVRLVPEEDPNVTWERHTRSGDCGMSAAAAQRKARCPVKGCKEQLTSVNSLECGGCGMRVCLKHRFEDDHNCPAAAARAAAAAASQPPVAVRRQQWSCTRCTLLNAPAVLECAACGAVAPPIGVERAAPWKCPRCTLANTAATDACGACGAKNPAAASGSESGCCVA
eukprot:TRINITY_DN66731_c0_g1_i1.p1 TRINITY_DN66731_c0_g1~~TRINITY_DN66731_c0_g1_i1.p1  ORF type:complete len:231 (-),score=47.86 TRINITY_DN66731_c0_g1_i1:88-780(-)